MPRSRKSSRDKYYKELEKYTKKTNTVPSIPPRSEYIIYPLVSQTRDNSFEDEDLHWLDRYLRSNTPRVSEPVQGPPSVESIEIFELLEKAGSEPELLALSTLGTDHQYSSIDYTAPEQKLPHDQAALDFSKALIPIRRLFDNFLTNSRTALDILTFPTSCNYEPLSRLHGTLYMLSFTYRNIKLFGTFDDRTSFRTYISDEMKEFRKRSTAFVQGCNGLLTKFKTKFELLNSNLYILRRVQKRWNLELLLSKGLKDQIYLWPIYRSELDPREVTYYETLKTKNEDIDEYSVNFLWTDKYVFYKLFKSKTWYDLKDLTPRHQLSLLLSLNEQIRLLYFHFQLKLEQVVEKFTTECSQILNILDPFSTSLSNASESTTSDHVIFRVQCEVQRIETGRSRVKQMIDAFEKAITWIQDVTPDVAAMASLDTEEGKEYIWKFQSCAQNPIYKKICCPRALNSFFTDAHDFYRIRVGITEEVKQLLIDSSSSTTSSVNSAAKKLLERMEDRNKAEHKLLRNHEYEGILETRSGAVGSTITLAYFEASNRLETHEGNTVINVYTVGHSMREK